MNEFETMAGYIIHHTGRIPKVNEELQIHGNTFIITKAKQSRLKKLVKLITNEYGRFMIEIIPTGHNSLPENT
jgi:CBS domain containing-hemolysin-like protein